MAPRHFGFGKVNEAERVLEAYAPKMVEALREDGVPRALILDYPLGQPFGPAHEVEKHRQILRACLDLIESATEPGTLQRGLQK